MTSQPPPDLSAPPTARFQNWDAGRYHELSTPHAAWGSNVLGHIRLRGDERVLDLGCGTGRLAAMVLRRFPRAQVIAVDASLAMAKRARAELGERASVVHHLTTTIRATARAAGDPDAISLWAGQAHALARAAPAAEIVRSLGEQARAAIRRAAQQLERQGNQGVHR